MTNNRHLYRGKRTDNGEWVYGDLINNSLSTGRKYIAVPASTTVNYLVFCEIEPNTISQCTGLSAKKSYSGEEERDLLIFDKDTIEDVNGMRFMVDFRNGSWVLVHSPTCRSEAEGECKWDYLFDYCFELKIISTIHDNPELLEG
jgi:hypothetical protein